ncbi:hypothetical protein I315_03892 [Cryptococcus gattii Ru294]|uniref:Uncharacterized protein n=6 Tax=Cryptococcus gattii species complex TaxID=1884637 RepID=E6QXY9_CRYGW|nr:Hypothetical Protein CGB_A5440C [Cryptococcus gattii WM276]KIR48443.1 hypothetical protein I312_02289 [Cryptococcus bacillisporus CA1280]KIR53766.1 hypothetical protein I315_03892 [Cryptococcus gattii Ru294]KIR69221.1 hypothetical protein I314_00327 [Cryptococcus bacillisporus CA1873]KIR79653.1 hypothetical protein I306_03278 [Cryptococcus gattii EJB2]KIR86668.1 hypothetical protein I308_02987 [Cryptococcus tetragattii IND107]KIY37109.1 hypothetical protein I305_00202 [Cryptococcus gattii |eukprot:KIR69221.1 hypothetical protein I314_00327 [Cryptococcus gattii CA1873]
MSYTIAGRAIKNEYLALGTIISTIGIAVASSGGSDKAAASSAPVSVSDDKTITGETPEEEDFIRQFVAEAEKSEKH